MVLVDTLSRLPNPENNAKVKLDIRVDCIDLVFDDPEWENDCTTQLSFTQATPTTRRNNARVSTERTITQCSHMMAM